MCARAVQLRHSRRESETRVKEVGAKTCLDYYVITGSGFQSVCSAVRHDPGTIGSSPISLSRTGAVH
jgi:hypothetical protein